MKKQIPKAFILTIILFLFLDNVYSQSNEANNYANLISVNELKNDIYALADSKMAGRKTGSEGFYLSEKYIVSQFEKANLQQPFANSYLQQYYVSKDTVMPWVFTIEKTKLDFGIDFYISYLFRRGKELEANGIVFPGGGSNENDYKSKNLKNKLVLIFPVAGDDSSLKDESEQSLDKKIMLAAKMGATAVLIPSSKFDSLPINPDIDDVNNTFRHLREKYFLGFPVIYISMPALKKIIGAEKFSVLSDKVVKRDPLNNNFFDIQVEIKLKSSPFKVRKKVSNIIGYIPGNKKRNEYVIIGAHYDHVGVEGGQIYLGADDNASGTAALISIAKAFANAKSNGVDFKRTIVFIAFSGEEEGLWGSKIYNDFPVFLQDSTSAMLNMDMIGRLDGRGGRHSADYVYVLGGNRTSPDFHPLVKKIAKEVSLYPDYKFEYNDKEMFFYRSDQYSFAAKGIPVLFVFDGMKKDYHLPTDTPDKINYVVLQKRAKFVFFLAWDIANRDKMLQRRK